MGLPQYNQDYANYGNVYSTISKEIICISDGVITYNLKDIIIIIYV